MKEIQVVIAEHGSGFTRYWIDYCKREGLSYKLINCYRSNIIQELSNFDIFLWNWDHESSEDALIARHIIYAAELMGVKVFPDTWTCWTFDDKVAQKYVLESIGAPVVPSYVFFDKRSAMEWVKKTSFPKVFKLRKGAGSKNVILVRDAGKAKELVKRAFGKGFKPAGRFVLDVVERFAIGTKKQRLAMLNKMSQIPQRLKHIYYINKLWAESMVIYIFRILFLITNLTRE